MMFMMSYDVMMHAIVLITFKTMGRRQQVQGS